jgi:peptidyl-tRNA hydrolase, PTH1 family
MKLIVGLGNPGEKYAGNRHNIGFMAVDEMARGYTFAPWKKRFQGLTAEGQIGLERCILLKPSTYMNESGRAVGEAMRYYKIALADVIVFHDEIDLKPGAIRVKRGGGNAGHNGLRSITAHIGNDYQRVRLGVDHPGDKAQVANYVLQDFAKADEQWLIPLLEGVARGMAKLVEGSEAAFLSEAARGRKAPAPAAKLNGASAPHHVVEALEEKAPAEPSEAETLAAIAAAASKPIEPLPAPALAVRETPAPKAEPIETALVETAIEARSDTAIPAPAPEAIAPHAETFAPEPQPRPAPASAAEEAPAPEIEPAPAVKPEPILQPQPVELQPAQQDAAKAKPAVVSEPPAKKPEAPKAAAKLEPAPPAKKQGNIFQRWFRNRVRGGGSH